MRFIRRAPLRARALVQARTTPELTWLLAALLLACLAALSASGAPEIVRALRALGLADAFGAAG